MWSCSPLSPRDPKCVWVSVCGCAVEGSWQAHIKLVCISLCALIRLLECIRLVSDYIYVQDCTELFLDLLPDVSLQVHALGFLGLWKEIPNLRSGHQEHLLWPLLWLFCACLEWTVQRHGRGEAQILWVLPVISNLSVFLNFAIEAIRFGEGQARWLILSWLGIVCDTGKRNQIFFFAKGRERDAYNIPFKLITKLCNYMCAPPPSLLSAQETAEPAVQLLNQYLAR